MSFSTRSSASRICITVAVSVMSWVVAPQWHHSPEPVGAHRDDLLHHRQHRIADALGLPLELGEIDVLDLAGALDLVRGLRRNDAEPRLDARERRLEFEIERDAPSRPRTRGASSSVVKMSPRIVESSAVAGMCLPATARAGAPAMISERQGDPAIASRSSRGRCDSGTRVSKSRTGTLQSPSPGLGENYCFLARLAFPFLGVRRRLALHRDVGPVSWRIRR